MLRSVGCDCLYISVGCDCLLRSVDWDCLQKNNEILSASFFKKVFELGARALGENLSWSFDKVIFIQPALTKS